MNFIKMNLGKSAASLVSRRWLRLSSSSRTTSCVPELPTPRMKVTILTNGMRVVTHPCPSYTNCVALFVAAGPRFEEPHLNGITHYIEHMAYKGFRSMPRKKLEEFVDETGVRFEVKTRRDMQVFRAHYVDPRDAAVIVDIFAKVITDLELSVEEIEFEKYTMCLKLLEKDNNPHSLVMDFLYQTAFQGTPLAQSIIGNTNNIRCFDADTALCYMSQKYDPSSMVLVAGGRVDHEDMVRFAETRLGTLLPLDCELENPCGPSRYTGSEKTYRDDSMYYAHVAFAVEAPGLNSPDYLPMLIAKNSLGRYNPGIAASDNNGFTLAKKISQPRVCFSYKPFYTVHCDVGLWGMYFIGRKTLDNMMIHITEEWMRMVHLSLESDLQQAKQWTKHKLAKRVFSVPGLVNDVGTQILQTGKRVSFHEYCKMIDEVKLAHYKQVLSTYLEDKCPVVAAVGPIEDLPEYNRNRSGMYWLRV